MRVFILILLLFPFANVCAQQVNLGKMSEKERSVYLIQMAKEVTKNFGPGYYREDSKPIITENVFKTDSKHEALLKLVGRKYYEVTFPYNKEKELLEKEYVSQVIIWENTGEPYGVMFGNGWGRSFLLRPYKEWVELGIEEDDSVKYQQVILDTRSIWKEE